MIMSTTALPTGNVEQGAHGQTAVHHPIANWQRGVWIGVACALGLTILLLLLFVGSTVGRVADLMASRGENDLAFAFSGMALLTLTLLRLLAILIGAGLAFGGLVVSFYSSATMANVEGGHEAAGGSLKAKLATNSPGIAAIVVGAAIILSALFAQGRHSYQAPYQWTPVTPEVNGGTNSAPNTNAPSAAEVLREPIPTEKRE